MRQRTEEFKHFPNLPPWLNRHNTYHRVLRVVQERTLTNGALQNWYMGTWIKPHPEKHISKDSRVVDKIAA